jgi:hypothetical protein
MLMSTKTTFLSAKPPTLEQARKIVGGNVQILTLADGSQMLDDEDGRAKNLPINESASMPSRVRGIHGLPADDDELLPSVAADWLEMEEMP